MIPVTRKELYLNKIVGNNEYETPEKPITTEEFFFAEILGEAVQAPEPLTRYQMYLAKIAGRDIEIPYPKTRLEYFLAKAAGMDITVPVPITREEIYWSNYTAIVEFEVENVPPLTYKAIEGTLKNYRIYGNTVNGNSVGDRTGNLFDGNFLQGYWAYADGKFIYVNTWICTTKIPCTGGQMYTYSFSKASRWFGFAWYDGDGNYISTNNLQDGSNTQYRLYCATAPSNATYMAINIAGYPDYNSTILPSDIADFMLVEGQYTIETMPAYEPYRCRVPVTVTNGTNTETTPIYLLEPIKMVGDEAEYIDYAEQKQHRVRKNLLQTTATSQTINGVEFIVNADGSVTCNGTNHGNNPIIFELNNPDVVFPEGVYITSGCPAGGSITGGYKIQYFNGSGWIYELGSGSTFTLSGNLNYRSRILISKDVTVTNLTFYPMLRLASIEDDTYEPYIENTDLDVTLPTLPTLPGTNVLSVGTAVQPSKVYVKYKGERQ